ncbi:MAG: GIY-YIG nuclease family protein [Bacteroidota bacterium]
MWYLNDLQSEANSRFYTGISEEPDKRLKAHNSGEVRSTRYYRPWRRVYLEECTSLQSAREREKYYKSGNGRERLKVILGSEG